MNPILGNKGEYLWLFGFLAIVPLFARGRKDNEEGIRSEVKANNRYARMDLDRQSAKMATTL